MNEAIITGDLLRSISNKKESLYCENLEGFKFGVRLRKTGDVIAKGFRFWFYVGRDIRVSHDGDSFILNLYPDNKTIYKFRRSIE